MAYQPRGKTFDEFNVGDEHTTQRRTITEADVVNFAGLSGDFNPLHTDELTGGATPFGGRIAHGLLTVAVATGLANQLALFEGTTLALLGMTLKFTGAVKFGDTVYVVLRVRDKKESSKPDRGVLTMDVAVRNQRGEDVVQSEWTLLMARRGG